MAKLAGLLKEQTMDEWIDESGDLFDDVEESHDRAKCPGCGGPSVWAYREKNDVDQPAPTMCDNCLDQESPRGKEIGKCPKCDHYGCEELNCDNCEECEEEKDVSVYDALNADDIDEQDNERFETDNYDSELYESAGEEERMKRILADLGIKPGEPADLDTAETEKCVECGDPDVYSDMRQLCQYCLEKADDHSASYITGADEMDEQVRNGERQRELKDESEGTETCRSCGHEECEGWMRSGKCARCPECEAEGNAPKDLDESINEISSDAPSFKRFGGLDSHPDHSDTDMECSMCGEVYDSEDAEYHASHLRGHKAKSENKSFVGGMDEQLSPKEYLAGYDESPIDPPDWERDEWGKIIDPDFPDDADKEFRRRGQEEQERYHNIDLSDLDNEKEAEQDLFGDDDGYGGDPYTDERPMKYESVKRIIRDIIRETYTIKGKK